MGSKKTAKIAVYAGTFDPITNGHQDIILRALGIFERIVVAVVKTPNKQTLFTPMDREQLVKESVKLLGRSKSSRVTVKCFDGLLVDFVHSLSVNVIIRGLRAVSDYEYESQMAVINSHLAPDIETVFLMTSDHCAYISSSVVREIKKNGGEVGGLVPKPVAKRLAEVYS